MKQMIFTAFFILAFCFAMMAQTNEMSDVPIIDPDVFGKMSWKKEMTLLDNFSESLYKDENRVVFITLRFDKNANQNYIRKRLRRITSYLGKTKKIEKNRFNLIISPSYGIEETMYWIVDKSEITEK